jgi:Xaa-Pro aminopeptidase
VQAAAAAGRPLHGFEVDRAARAVVEARGYGPRFVHRTGHSLGVELHANGVNMDDLETRDERLVLPGLAFTIEPGVYLEGELGVRSEVNVLMEEGRARVTTTAQRDLVLLG